MNKNQDGGISLKTIHIFLVIVTVIICVIVLFVTYRLSNRFQQLTETSEQQIGLRKAARELMDASDYLTEKVQRFCLLGNKQFLDEYFAEAFEAKHREEALEKMSSATGNAIALEKFQMAMDSSLKLMEREYYAMRLMVESLGLKEYPKVLQSVKLSSDEMMLSPEEKKYRAAVLVHDEEYYKQKYFIRANMKACLNELEKMAYSTDLSALDFLRKKLNIVRFVIVLQIIGICFVVWLMGRLGISPILEAVECIKEDSPIQEVGANEFRYLARAYNKMYEVYRKSLEHLNFKASHDELTGVYNRTGYQLLLSSIDLSSIYMLLFDLDNFKNINDTYGHEVGDAILKKLVRVLKTKFRSDDYICRVGGDEFVVFMIHTTEMKKELMAQKIEDINNTLEKSDDGLPATSVSVGIVKGTDVTDAEKLFEKTDEAMYKSKKNGKRTYSFYEK